MSEFFVYTNSEYDRSKYRPAGAVIVNHVESISAARAFAAEFMGAFGNKSELITKKVDDAVASATEGLIQKTKAKYPNAAGLVDLKLNTTGVTSSENSTFVLVNALGTAVVPITVGGRKTRRTLRK